MPADGQGPPPPTRTGSGRTFDSLLLAVRDVDLGWFDAREGFPGRLMPGACAAARRADQGLGAWLAHMAPSTASPGDGVGYARSLCATVEIDDAYDETVAMDGYLPISQCVRLPDSSTVHAVACWRPDKRHPPLSIDVACNEGNVDREAMARYYLECVLAAEHGIDVTDLRSPTFEASIDGWQNRYAEGARQERWP